MSHPEITVSVATQFMPDQSSAAEDVYAFAYTVKIRNSGDIAAQVVARRWLITHGSGQVEEVRGLAVVGEQPLLQPGEQFEYTSWTRISTPRGRMQGAYICITADAHWFEAEVAPFELAVAQAIH